MIIDALPNADNRRIAAIVQLSIVRSNRIKGVRPISA
jgi:hypothetical protein